MGKYNTLGRECEQLYKDGNSLETIKEITGVSLRSLSIWKNKYNWDIKREEYQRLPAAIHKKVSKVFSVYLDELIENGIQSHKNADAVAKLASAHNTTGGIEDIPGMAVTIVPRFVRHIQENCRDEEFMDKLHSYTQSYFKKEKERAYGIE